MQDGEGEKQTLLVVDRPSCKACSNIASNLSALSLHFDHLEEERFQRVGERLSFGWPFPAQSSIFSQRGVYFLVLSLLLAILILQHRTTIIVVS